VINPDSRAAVKSIVNTRGFRAFAAFSAFSFPFFAFAALSFPAVVNVEAVVVEAVGAAGEAVVVVAAAAAFSFDAVVADGACAEEEVEDAEPLLVLAVVGEGTCALDVADSVVVIAFEEEQMSDFEFC